MKISIVSRGGDVLVQEVRLAEDATVLDLKLAFQQLKPQYSIHRQAFSHTLGKEKTSLKDDNALLKSYGVKDSTALSFADLGMRIGWRLVFVLEYLGPLLIHPLFFYFYRPYSLSASSAYLVPHFSLSGGGSKSFVQVACFWMVMLHFLKREFETLFVHRFSHATMPVMNLFKNCAHYWLLSGALLAWDVYAPHPHSSASATTFQWLLIGVWIWAEVSNFWTHVILRRLRPNDNSSQRRIPHGYGFDAPFNLSCPNYFFESVAWLALTVLTLSSTCALFTVVAVVQMALWALIKHKRYRRGFPTYPKSRLAMFPSVM